MLFARSIFLRSFYAAACIAWLLLLAAAPALGQSALVVHSGNTLRAEGGSLHLGGDFTNQGTFEAIDLSVAFIGGTAQTFAPGAALTLRRVVVDKSDATTAAVLTTGLTVTDSLLVLQGDLNLNGHQIDLGTTGGLREAPGQTVTGASGGTITATRLLDQPSARNVAGLGAQITSGRNMSATVVTRGHVPQSGSVAGNEGIARYYDIQPGVNSSLDATLEFFYDESELNGLDESTLELWRSEDEGGTYAKAGGSAFPTTNVVVLSGIDAFSRWTGVSSGEPLPVELTTFDAMQAADGVRLRWQTASETNNAGFAIERQVEGGSYTEVGFVEGAGTTSQPQTYRYADASLPYAAGTVVYRLKQIDTDGAFEYSNEVEIERGVPERLALHPNYPNPFRTRTTLRYALPQAGPVHLAVYDMTGRRVATLVDEEQEAGREEVVFDAQRLASGIYVVRLQANDRALIQKVTIVR